MPRIHSRGSRVADRRVGCVHAQIDLAGPWGQRSTKICRSAVPAPRSATTRVAVDDAARLRADTLGRRQVDDAGTASVEPHPADYAPRGPASLRI